MEKISTPLQLIALLIATIAALIAIYKFFKKRFKPNNTWVRVSETKYSLFISTPMSSFSTDAAYQQHREEIMELINALRKNTRFKSVYFSGESLKSQEEFITPDHAIMQDFGALEASAVFIMIFPGSVNSSVIVEAGYALALGKPSIYFVKDKKELPFMLREVAQISKAKVKVYEAASMKRVHDVMLQIINSSSAGNFN